MSKYIDADRLRKEVKRLEKAAHKFALGCADSETRKFHEGKDYAYQHVGILIDSLQQEQPELQEKDRAEYYYHKGVYEGISQGRADALKILDEFAKSKADPVVIIKQPDVDLEKAARHVYESWSGGTMDDVRRDMVELGKVLDARKEGQK